MNILIAPDSFKGSLGASAVADALARGLQRANGVFNIEKLPLADGGEGTLAALTAHQQFAECSVDVADPLGRTVSAKYGRKGAVAFLEMAQASGLMLLSPEERNPMLTSTFGTGQLTRHAVSSGAKRLVIGIGGSATNDVGVGMLSALGVEFYRGRDRLTVLSAKDIPLITRVSTDRLVALLAGVDIDVLCDVDNPLTGASGSSYVYAPQKGADMPMVVELDRILEGFRQLLIATRHIDANQIAGAGAAGGMGAALHIFCGAALISGIEGIMTMTNFREKLAKADLVITGEGKLDDQSRRGKLIAGIVGAASELDKPVIAVVGQSALSPSEAEEFGLTTLLSLVDAAASEQEAMAQVSYLLEDVAYRLGKSL